MSKIQTLEITSLTYGGDGFGRLPDGRACFVPFTLPGEQVQVTLTEEQTGHAGILAFAAVATTSTCLTRPNWQQSSRSLQSS
jgi:tRNA/tmRNA/rRNA uracil-C5-methylase (TrmA/RlmC/RlmD family)